jgi:hypothetical protein
LVREHYLDFGPPRLPLAAEDHDLKVSRETLRKWMQDARYSFHVSSAARLSAQIAPGMSDELVRSTGLIIALVRGSRTACTLLVFIDDATSTLLIQRGL